MRIILKQHFTINSCNQMFSVARAFLRKCQQVAEKQHLRMLINYGLTDVTECLQSLGFEKTVESQRSNPVIHTEQVGLYMDIKYNFVAHLLAYVWKLRTSVLRLSL